MPFYFFDLSLPKFAKTFSDHVNLTKCFFPCKFTDETFLALQINHSAFQDFKTCGKGSQTIFQNSQNMHYLIFEIWQ